MLWDEETKHNFNYVGVVTVQRKEQKEERMKGKKKGKERKYEENKKKGGRGELNFPFPSLIAVNTIWFGKNNTTRIIAVVAAIRVIFPFSLTLLSAVAADDFMVFQVMWAYIQIMVMQGTNTLKEE